MRGAGSSEPVHLGVLVLNFDHKRLAKDIWIERESEGEDERAADLLFAASCRRGSACCVLSPTPSL